MISSAISFCYYSNELHRTWIYVSINVLETVGRRISNTLNYDEWWFITIKLDFKICFFDGEKKTNQNDELDFWHVKVWFFVIMTLLEFYKNTKIYWKMSMKN